MTGESAEVVAGRGAMNGGDRGATGRRVLEIAFWVGVIALFWTLDTLTKLEERQRTGFGLDDFRLFTEQVTSGLAVFLMVAFVAAWLNRFPLERSHPVRLVAGHFVGSALFAVGHYALMVAFRKLVFWFNGMEYMRDQWHLPNLIFEYKKDLKIYLVIVAIIAAYRYFRRQRHEVAEMVAALDRLDGPEPRLAVQTRRGERLLQFDEVDYLEAARNYVEIHAGGELYLIRTTLGKLGGKLPERFVRTHRSFMVNLTAVTELRTSGSSWQLVLRDGSGVPVSRTYRDEVKSWLEELRVL